MQWHWVAKAVIKVWPFTHSDDIVQVNLFLENRINLPKYTKRRQFCVFNYTELSPLPPRSGKTRFLFNPISTRTNPESQRVCYTGQGTEETVAEMDVQR